MLSFDSLLCLAQALQAEDMGAPLRLTVLTAGSQSVRGERVRQPAQALALGPCRVIPQELPWVRTRLVDLPPTGLHGLKGLDGVEGELPRSLPRRLLAECLADDAADLVALRGCERLLMQLLPAGPSAVPTATGLPPHTRLRRGGVYLITGGLGAVALTLAEYLASTQQACLALLSRRSLPPADVWPGIVAAASAQALADIESESWLLQRLLALQASGAQLLLLSADVTDPEAMARALAHCRGRFGALHGVFHAAGVLDDGAIHAKTRASVGRVLGPKALGAQVLDQLLPPGSLDFFAVFSSTSVYLGAPGQIDYLAANAYLDALAASRPDGLCIHWGIWGDAGMARRAYAPVDNSSAIHPLLGRRVDEDVPDLKRGARFMALMNPADLWLLREHQVAGQPVLVGMAYVEMARAALQCLRPGLALEMRSLSFGQAMVFEGHAPREVMTTLQAESRQARGCDGGTAVYTFEVQSRASSDAPWQAHARASVVALEGAALEAAKAEEAFKSRLFPEATASGVPWQAGQTPQARWLGFGPHWQCVQRMKLKAGNPLAWGKAELALPEDCRRELPLLAFHPALADMASTFALQLPQVQGSALYVPLSVARIRLFAPLGTELTSRASLKKQDGDRLVGFDVQMQAPSGELLASFEGFYLRGVVPEALGSPLAEPDAASSRERKLARQPSLIERMLAAGIRKADAPALFDRIFSGAEPDLVISSMALPALHAALAPRTPAHPPTRALPEQAQAGSEAAPAALLSSMSAAKGQDPVHEAVVAVWRELLGVDALSNDDDFFALGGHSLAAVRLFARIRKVFGVDLPLATLFETPTLGALVERVRAECPPAAVTAAAPDTASAPGVAVNTAQTPSARNAAGAQPQSFMQVTPEATEVSVSSSALVASPRAWSPLVRINAGRAGVKPLFCVHGAAGNVLNFKVIADSLGAAQPFYGLQAQGVDGRLSPLPTIEAMASRYVAAIREVDPVGPYHLAGYSGGGVIAFEMAQQLRCAGAPVALLAMLDTLAPAAASARLSPLRKLWLMRHWSLGFTLAWPERRRVRRTEQMNHLLALQALARGEPLTPEQASARLFSHFVSAQSQYQPQPYVDNLLLLRAEQGYTPYLNAGPQLGWQALVRGSIRVVEIPGSHVSMLTEPGLSQLAGALREHLSPQDDGRGPRSGPPDTGSPERDSHAMPGAFMPGMFGNAMQRDFL
jgi:thioesterase domain-containing protein/NAD(P)-dependent dehydrogenase (short-subunit alcohol dehydrogenase family)/acyl carrier protein